MRIRDLLPERHNPAEHNYALHSLTTMDRKELAGLYRRSVGVQIFAGALGLVSVVLGALFVADIPGMHPDAISIPGLGGVATLSFFALAIWGAYQRTVWGRWLCLAIAGVCLLQASWYGSSPSHWNMRGDFWGMAGRFALGWVGLICFFGTEQLFGAMRLDHASLKDAYKNQAENREQLARIHAMDWTSSHDQAA